MILTNLGILVRIISNSYLNVFQKLLTNKGQNSSVVNFYTYLGLSVVGLMFCGNVFGILSKELLQNVLIMGFLGACGNYFIIKALSVGELSTLAPINSYKPIVALIVAFFYLKEIPSLNCFLGVLLIILGTFLLNEFCIKNKFAVFYRILALIFSGTEAVFIKKVIILSNSWHAFIYWAISGFIFSAILLIFAKHIPKLVNYKLQLGLILTVGIMQYTTNYVFERMQVSYALALFQLSTLLSVFIGANIFKETGLCRKLVASFVMIAGATVIILS